MKKIIITVLTIVIAITAKAQSDNGAKKTIKENPIVIGTTSSMYVPKSQLLIDPVLRMPEANKNYHIRSFEISYVPNGKASDVQGPFQINGDNMTTGKAADILNKAQPGDRIFFENIVAVSDDATNQPLKLAASIKVQ